MQLHKLKRSTGRAGDLLLIAHSSPSNGDIRKGELAMLLGFEPFNDHGSYIVSILHKGDIKQIRSTWFFKRIVP